MTVASINNLGLLYDQLERFEDAEPLLREALEVRRRTLAAEHPDVLLSMHNLAGSYLRQGRYELAEPLFVETLEMCQQTLGPDSRDTLITQTALGVLYSRSDRPELAEPLFRDIVTRFRATLPEGHWFLGSALSNHGSSLTKLQHFAEAESNLLEAYELLSAGLGEEHVRTRNAAARLIDLYEAWQRPGDAEAWRPRAADDAAAGGG